MLSSSERSNDGRPTVDTLVSQGYRKFKFGKDVYFVKEGEAMTLHGQPLAHYPCTDGAPMAQAAMSAYTCGTGSNHIVLEGAFLVGPNGELIEVKDDKVLVALEKRLDISVIL